MRREPRRRVAVVGAGILGLVAARELARRGHAVEVFERWPDVGGQASAFDLGGGVWLDRYYHHLFRSDADMRALHDELLPGELEWWPSRTAMFRDGRVWPFVTPLDLLRYRPLPLVDRLRLGLATVALTRRRDVERMDATAALAWLRRACGQRAVDAVWAPLLLAKFGDDAARVPLAWLWSKLVLRRGRGGDAGRELLGYPRGSFRAIARALADDVTRHGGAIHVDRPVRFVDRRDGGYVLRLAAPGAYRLPADAWTGGGEAEAELVLFTTPTDVTRALADWPPADAARFEEWRYVAALVLVLELRRRFTSAYWLNVADPGMPFLGLIEHTNLVPAERYPARYLYVSNYVPPDDPRTYLSTDALLAYVLPGLARIAPGFSERDVLRRWSFVEPAAQPVPRAPNAPRVAPFETSLPGVFVANTTQIYPEDRGTNYSARLGRVVAARIAG